MEKDIQFHEIKVQLPELRTWFRDAEMYPSLTELKLLMIFLSDPYHQFTYEELIRRLQLTSASALAVNVWKLRKMLDQRYIVTVHGCGYAFAEQRKN